MDKMRKGKIALFFVIASSSILLRSVQSRNLPFLAEPGGGEKQCIKILREIYDEVKELGPYPGEDFIRREFFVGKDDDDTNKDQHVVVLIQNAQGQEKMRIQVTWMEPGKENPQVKYAGNVKNIWCVIIRNNITIQKSDYTERELDKSTPEILRAIRNKKKLLKQSRLAGFSSLG